MPLTDGVFAVSDYGTLQSSNYRNWQDALSDPYPHPMIQDLVHTMETGRDPLLSVENAITAFETGLSIFQSHREGNRTIRPRDLDETLRIDSV